MAEQGPRQRGRPTTQPRPQPSQQQETGTQRGYLQNAAQVNALLEMSETDLRQWASEVQLEAELESETAQNWLDAGTLPDLEAEDEDAWELGDAERESDDWDWLDDTNDRDAWVDQPEAPLIQGQAHAVRPMRPSVIVEIVQERPHRRLTVRLAHEVPLYNLIAKWQEQGHTERAWALQNRLERLLELSQALVKHQEMFLLQKGHRKPLTARDLAQTLWNDTSHAEAKISRLAKGKGLQTPEGDVMALRYLMPSDRECRLEHLCDILRQKELGLTEDGRSVEQGVLKVEDIAKELRERLGDSKGLSLENVKDLMAKNNIPGLGSKRQKAYEEGTAWWMTT